jgi:hypothetical protein
LVPQISDPVLCEHQQHLCENLQLDDEEFIRNLYDCLYDFQITAVQTERNIFIARMKLLEALQKNIDDHVDNDPESQPLYKFIACLNRCHELSLNYNLSLLLKKTYEDRTKGLMARL